MTEVTMMNESAAWHAVVERDAGSDGRFVYGVATTGVFCRPSCPSRRPLRANVRFFGDIASAERAGFRACRRCRPEAAGSPMAERVERARAFLDAHLDEKISLAELGRAAGTSPSHLQRAFTRIVGRSPRSYVAARRAERLAGALREAPSVSRAIYDAGYGSSSRGYAEASRRLGMSPSAYRRGGEGMEIEYTVVPCALGRLLVARTARGVCAVALGDHDATVIRELAVEYPRARRIRADHALRPTARAVRAQVEGDPVGPTELDVPGTDFQWRVWRALQRIPAGETRTYAEIAEAIGRPGAARAVARACAGNRVAVMIPCHRVVRGDTGLGGYRWGVERKEALLAREAGGVTPPARSA
jgi:AraC family transcriptional regulator of adaptative response/methylated-DNA-[protein]-cysteine methyltransferase